MLYFPNDMYVGRSLDLYGEYSEGEVIFYNWVSQWGGDAIDCGANMGAITVPLAKKFDHVFAFEPQKIIFRLLRANTADLLNVTSYNSAVGSGDGLIQFPVLNYALSNNYGGMGREIKVAEGALLENIQVRQLDKVDAIRQSDKIGLIKIDVEGMESEVIEGAMATIDKHRPFLYVENDKPKHSSQLVNMIYNLDYKAFWHFTTLYNSENYFENSENVYADITNFNIICVPREHKAEISGCIECTPDNPYLPAGYVTSYD